ncbi:MULTISPECIES: 4'-phosphopantetheinyl transferase family protein [Vibrio]|uniref:4'-phosphopantetheinyl transferase family protein n=1 Tax=Vibrio TaxID=662 RepID=UPI002074EE89|nr:MULTISPECIES: 4'-phosphopantetheinyl transferase superfamily protein [Vibrio]USD31287.1 4'-phosphopantetheinyl transferase superfamily protein [Vibrio sp. SCSIO 43186]USD44332.1 4'-phosphopantetheinyl transferase superfamily protein [Vibrio sp. SCSIO 43145]USD68410.1 4'-phosphopantetheinyl transferase superfamily protein [Vibrio sp. SCSIO 43139]USD96095.1 phosphopantetheinyl transferase [Vibrio coralliilyticus]
MNTLIKSEQNWLQSLPHLPFTVNQMELVVCMVSYDKSLFTKSLYSIRVLPNSIRKAHFSRQAEFVAGRTAAENAMALLGESHKIGINLDRSPNFPSHLTGSISHCENYALAVVERKTKLADHHLGVDIQRVLSDQEVQDTQAFIAREEEIDLLVQTGLSRNEAVTLLFSAKESLYKAIYPQVQEILEFDVVRLVKSSENSLRFESNQYLISKGISRTLESHYAWFQQCVICLSKVAV